MKKLCFYVPERFLEPVKDAVFAAGAGQLGRYDRCCWQVQGIGQFRPMPGSRPFLGREQVQEQVSEYRVEMLCEDSCIASVLSALVEAHPYEEPAWDVTDVLAPSGVSRSSDGCSP